MLNTCVAKFDVKENLKSFLFLGATRPCLEHLQETR